MRRRRLVLWRAPAYTRTGGHDHSYFFKIHSVPEHTIEFIRNNWTKTLKLLIDGKEAARAWSMFPGHRTLIGTLMHAGVPRAVVATSVPHGLLWTKDTIEIDGQALTLTSTN